MRLLILAHTTLLMTPSALAHHPLAGLLMETSTHGFLSGVGHPLLGFDHLFFVVLVGIIATFTQRKLLAPAIYIVAMLAGCLLTSKWFALPATELIIALSLLIGGSLVLSGYRIQLHNALIIFSIFGLFHGAAFGGSLAAQESGFSLAVLTGYLAGLAVTQYLIALTAGWICIKSATNQRDIKPRLAGAMVAGAGLLLTLEQLEAPLLVWISG